eukprot:6776928-Prymnesium_polylepis.2
MQGGAGWAGKLAGARVQLSFSLEWRKGRAWVGSPAVPATATAGACWTACSSGSAPAHRTSACTRPDGATSRLPLAARRPPPPPAASGRPRSITFE